MIYLALKPKVISNMTTKLFFLFALIFAVQANEISIETRQKLQQAMRELVDAKRESGRQINAITDVIEHNIDAALDPIKNDIRKLDLEVRAAQQKAKLSDVDISECVEQERHGVHNVDKDDVKKCRQTPETEVAHTKVGQIGEEIHKVRESPHACYTNADADKCVLAAIASGEKRVKALQREITAVLKHAKPEKQNKCISSGAAKLRKQVDEIKENWEECMKKNDKPDN